MSGGRPEPVPFDPSEAPRPELRATLLGLSDVPVLVLVAGRGADEWRRRAAIAVADAISTPERRALLLDLHVPTDLGGLLGAPVGDGVEDVLAFGASIEHAEQRPAGHAFDFLGPGASATDAGLLASSEGWAPLLRRLRTSGRRVVLYVPEDALPAGWAGEMRTVLLAPDGSEATRTLRSSAWLTPPRSRATADAEYERVRVPRAAEREAYIAEQRRAGKPVDARSGEAAGTPHPGPAGAPPPAAGGPPPEAPPVPPPAEPLRHLAEPMVARPVRRRRGRRPLAWAIGVALLVSLVAGAWHYLVRDWLEQRRGATAPPPVTATDTAQPASPEPVALAWSVAIEAHDDLPTAQRRVASLAAGDPSVGYFISPVLVDSVLYYRVLAGPVADSAAAALVMQRLVAAGQKTAAAARDIRRAPLSFLIGRFADREAAEQERERLRVLDIPAFVLPTPARTDGTHRLYAGAYSGLAEADVMARLLRSAGLPDSLVTLTGGSP